MSAGGNEPPRPNGERPPHGMRRDLQDLRKLPRSALISYQKKHAQPHRPRRGRKLVSAWRIQLSPPSRLTDFGGG